MESNFIVNTILKTVVLPMVTAGILGGILSRITKDPTTRDLAAAVALAAGFLVGFSAIGEFQLIPIQVRDWLPHATLIPLLILVLPAKPLVRAGVLLPTLGLFLWLHFKPLLKSREPSQILLPAAVAAVLWFLITAAQHPRDQMTARDMTTTPATWLFLVIAGTAVSLICVLDGSVTMGQIAGSLAAVCGALFLLNLKLDNLSPGPASHLVFFVVLGCLLLNAYIYVQVNLVAVLLAVAVSLAPFLRWIPTYRDQSSLKRALILYGAALVPLIAAVVFLILNAPEDPYGY